MTILCGSLSRHPVSLGAVMHRAGYAALGLDYAYVPFAVSDLAGALGGMRALGIRGFGVSMPFKLDVIPLLDAMDPLAQRIGAVNTIVNDAGVLTGHNTDAAGAVRALSERISPQGKRVAVIGAGGAARAVCFGLLDAGAQVGVYNRTPAAGVALAAELAKSFGRTVASAPLGQLDLTGVDVLVNASSAGMQEYGAESPVPRSQLRRDLVVMDIVYKPAQTELLSLASQCGSPVVHGGRMLLHQACLQFELYTGHPAPLEAMDAAFRSNL